MNELGPAINYYSTAHILNWLTAWLLPTRLRSRGSGLGAGISKAGGVIIIGLVVMSVASTSILGTSLIGAVPMGLAAIALTMFGVEIPKAPA